MKEEQIFKKIDKLKKNILAKIHHIEKYEIKIKELKTEMRLDQKILDKFQKEKQYGSTTQMKNRIKDYKNEILKVQYKIDKDENFLDKIKIKLDSLVKESEQQSKV